MIDLTEKIRERYEKRLRKILKINRYLTYNKDVSLGPIGAWILTSKKGISDACKLLVERPIGIFIHRTYGSAKFTWDHLEQEFIMQIWYNQNLIKESKTKNLDELKIMINEAWKYCNTKK